MRSLNTLKNFRLGKYDIAFKEMLNDDESEQSQNSINDIRSMFFNFLKPYLEEVECFIDKTKQAADVNTVFGKYFDVKGYLREFEQDKCYSFAERLVNSS